MMRSARYSDLQLYSDRNPLAHAIETIPSTMLNKVINKAPNCFTLWRNKSIFTPDFEV